MKSICLVLFLFSSLISAQEVIIYKTIGDIKLEMNIFKPADWKASDKRPAIVFFFGGGWVSGSPKQFFKQCEELTKLGMVAMSAEYRIFSKHKTSPFECVADGKSAIRWARKNAESLGINPDMLAAGGGSAGGHVAASTGVIPEHEDPNDDLSLSSIPNLMILFNPVIDTTSKGYGVEKVKGRETEISPAHNVRKGIPPTLIQVGEDDTTTPLENDQRFAKLMTEAGNECVLITYPGQKHGFFNTGKSYTDTVEQMVKFLQKHNYVK
jgi:acetyl esterase